MKKINNLKAIKFLLVIIEGNKYLVEEKFCLQNWIRLALLQYTAKCNILNIIIQNC